MRRIRTEFPLNGLRTAVIGHVEWTSIARVARIPKCGDVVHADVVWEGPAGGGAVAAAQLAALAGHTLFLTALGDDSAGRRSHGILQKLGVEVVAAPRTQPTRTAVSLVDDSGERTTTTLGPRLQPTEYDDLPWARLADCDVVHFVAGGTSVTHRARTARVLTASSRENATLARAGISVDAVIGSSTDPAEQYDAAAFAHQPALVVQTEGRAGGRYLRNGQAPARYRAVRAPAPEVDSYGMGDNFAAALSYYLACGDDAPEALTRAARRAATYASLRGPFALPA